MPVVFSQTLDADTLQPEDFEVTSKSGDVHTPKCATLRPAQDQGELRTVLLIGEFGDSLNYDYFGRLNADEVSYLQRIARAVVADFRVREM